MPIHDLPVLSVGLAPHHHVEAHDSAFCSLDAHHGHGDSASTSFCGANSSAAAKPSSFCAGSSDKPTSFVHNHHDPAIKETSFNEYDVRPGGNPLGNRVDHKYQKIPVNIKVLDYRVDPTDQGPKLLPEGPALRLITQPRGDGLQIRVQEYKNAENAVNPAMAGFDFLPAPVLGLLAAAWQYLAPSATDATPKNVVCSQSRWKDFFA